MTSTDSRADVLSTEEKEQIEHQHAGRGKEGKVRENAEERRGGPTRQMKITSTRFKRPLGIIPQIPSCVKGQRRKEGRKSSMFGGRGDSLKRLNLID